MIENVEDLTIVENHENLPNYLAVYIVVLA